MLVTHLKFKILQPHFSVTNTMKRLQDNEKTNLRLLKKTEKKANIANYIFESRSILGTKYAVY